MPTLRSLQQGKRSIAIDMATAEGQQLAQDLIGSADVFLSNMRPQYLSRVGLGSDQLTARYPRLVYASLTGYGLKGPDADAPGFDVAAFAARGGVANRATPEGDAPPILPGGMGDNVTALSLVGGILAALLRRERTGKGQLVSTSLLRSGIYAIGMDVSIRVGLGRIAPAPSRRKPQNPLMNPYRTSDGRWFWMIGAEAERHWPGVVAALDDDLLRAEDLFGSARLRRRNAEELVGRLDQILARRTREEWAERFKLHDVWWAPVNSADDLLDDPQVLAAGAFVDVPLADGDGSETGVATPVDFASEPAGPAAGVPSVGQHTDALLGEIGLGAERINALRSTGVVS